MPRLIAALFLAAVLSVGDASAQSGNSVPPSAGPSTWESPKWFYYFAGSTYVVSTNTMTVPAGHFATATICNTSASKTVHIFRRRFDNSVPSGTAPLMYGGISGTSNASISSTSTASSDTAAATGTPSDLVNTYPASSNVTATYAVGTTTVNGTIVATGYLPPSTPYELQEPRGIGPGTCQAQFISNPSTVNSYKAVLTVYWWEQ